MRYYIQTSDNRSLWLLRLLKQKSADAQQLTPQSASTMQKGDVCVFSPAFRLAPADVDGLQGGVTLFSGNLTASAADALGQKGITHVNFMSDQVFACKNAALTAEGVLALLIQNTEKSVYQNNILILGLGRCAKAAARLFGRLGLRFSLVTFSEGKLGEGFLLAENCYLKNGFVADLDRFDVIINTVPAKILCGEAFKIKKNTLLIEVASTPCLDAEEAAAAGINYLPAPALPQTFCCRSAAQLMLEAVERLS